MFLSLALVKRCAELVSLEENGVKATRGRDYRVTDLVVLWAVSERPVGRCCVRAVYQCAEASTQPAQRWLAAIGLIYWLARLWIKTSRGEMRDDPVVYAIKDHGSRVTVFSMITVVLVAHFMTLGSTL